MKRVTIAFFPGMDGDTSIQQIDGVLADGTVLDDFLPFAPMPEGTSLGKEIPPEALVQVVNIEDMSLVETYCGQGFDTMPALAENHRFLITVGVTWVPKFQAEELAVDRVVVSTVLPL